MRPIVAVVIVVTPFIAVVLVPGAPPLIVSIVSKLEKCMET
jgi:hypothetical protein